MEKECCDIKVTEIDGGYRLDVKGPDLKERFMEMLKHCCGDEAKKHMFKSCCDTGK